MSLSVRRIVVTAGRKFTDAARIESDLRALIPFGLARVAEGGAPGGDQLARKAWFWECARLQMNGLTSRARTAEQYSVDHALDGPWPAAGPRRNIRMLEAERPDLVPAYPDNDSRGTWDCIAEALNRGITCAVWVPWAPAGARADVVAVALRRAGTRCWSELERGCRVIVGEARLFSPAPLDAVADALDGVSVEVLGG